MRAAPPSSVKAAFRVPPGFTLIEVILAIGISIGLLLAVLFFYNQVVRLRQSMLEETERTAAARLILSRLTSELRAARPHEILWLSLNGTSYSIEFIATSLPSQSSWDQDALEQSHHPESDLRLFRYSLAGADDPSQSTGVARSEVPVLETDFFLPDEDSEDGAALDLIGSIPNPNPELLTPYLRYLRFRYWDGSSWLDAWSEIDLPLGVEVTLGPEPLPEDFNEEDLAFEYPFELFRRIIYLPGSRPLETASSFMDALTEQVSPEVVP